jgi:cobalamin biosynthesis protein CobD/CbiB
MISQTSDPNSEIISVNKYRYEQISSWQQQLKNIIDDYTNKQKKYQRRVVGALSASCVLPVAIGIGVFVATVIASILNVVAKNVVMYNRKIT